MIHKSKGKYKFQNKATYCVSSGLSPIIKAYLEQLLTNKEKSGFGIPWYYCELQAKEQGNDSYDFSVDIDLEAALEKRVRDIEELIWVFSDNEPNPCDYGVEYDFTGGSFKCVTPEPRDLYMKDMNEWNKRKKAGYELFGRVYNTLDW